jgi:hypothetical protein
MTTRCLIGVVVEDVKEAAEAFIAPPVTRDNINANDIHDDTNIVFIRSQQLD